ncbi:M56 family metallopeptidase [Terriglobus sp. TAA 43]|uniref:M56 family metallopeptidase n=1 Tax=Terriglobus sp. TAA 43 TaxID=278961 RepID=UPI000648A272|nr:M56 family metallopeptidase [Terriglobus sp. TAA 43]
MIREAISLVQKAEPTLANHLLQSTIFATMLGLLTLSLRNNRARVRHWLWLAASVKFLLPFSLLFALGSLLPKQHSASFNHPSLSNALESVGQPFSGLVIVPEAPLQDLPHETAGYLALTLMSVWGLGTLVVFAIWGMRWMQVFASLKQAAPLINGREVEILQRVESLVSVSRQVVVLGASDLTEPGIFGIVRPVMLWPLQLTERLENEHIESILVHELMHVRRHDNLIAAIHMAVEALFWFHPLVWWIGTRMVLEREHACDEATVQLIGKPSVYAESLLKASRFCVEAPIVCVSGMASADLKNRIVRIMTGHVVENLTLLRRLLLGTVVCLSLIIPVFFGVVRAASTQNSRAATGKQLEFSVVSIRPNEPGGPQTVGAATQDGYEMRNMFLALPILSAYVPQTGGASAYSDKEVIGLPGWAYSDDARYNISAKVDEADLADWHDPVKQPEMLQAMLQSMLADRLKLVVHREMKNAQVYLLTVDKDGPKFKESNPAEAHAGAHPFPGGGMLSMARSEGEISIHFFGITIAQLTHSLSADWQVQDRTGLSGKYDITLRKPIASSVSPDGLQQAPEEASPGSLAQQIGLKLVPAKGKVETLVIDHIERPSEN